MSFRPLIGRLAKLLGRPLPDLLALSRERWEIAPGSSATLPPAICLPDQIERIRATEFVPKEAVIRAFRGGFDVQHGPTFGFRLAGVDLVDGVLYGPQGQRHLRARQAGGIWYRRPDQAISGAMYESWVGNRWFGNWLSDDCLTYRLAEAAGVPFTSTLAGSGHVPEYEALLAIQPRRGTSVHFDELILFDDGSDNAGKRQRAADMRARLMAGRQVAPVPGVVLLRGGSGDARRLQNERAIAEHLAAHRGFRVLDPSAATVAEIVDLCAQAAVVLGVEGSHLVHALAVMPPRSTLMVIQPPDRVVAALKTVTDRQDQRYAFVVAEGTATDFRANPGEIERTLDLIS